MQKKEVKNKTPQDSSPTDWVDYLQDDNLMIGAVPVGQHFQVDVPEWTTQTNEKTRKENKSDTLRRGGTQIWPPKSRSKGTKKNNMNATGKGRPDSCSCEFPSSAECIKSHVAEERTKLERELGPAFFTWKWDEMGEDVAKSWTEEEQKKFESIVKANPTSKGANFMDPALEALPSQNRRSIVNYYFNVYLPRRISEQIRSGCKIVDTDDEGPEEGSEEAPKTPRGSKRRRRNVDTTKAQSSNCSKITYLTGKR